MPPALLSIVLYSAHSRTLIQDVNTERAYTHMTAGRCDILADEKFIYQKFVSPTQTSS